MQSSLDMHLGKCLYIYRMPSAKRSGIWEQLGILEEFLIVEKKVSTNSNKIPTNSSNQGHSMDKKLRDLLGT